MKKSKIDVKGSELVDAVKKLMHEGNIRRIKIKQNDKVLVEFPLTVGVVGAILVPALAALGAIAALVTRCTIEVERQKQEPLKAKKKPKRKKKK